jgi:hypothetical protein
MQLKGCVKPSDSGADSSPNTSAFRPQYHSVSVAHLIIASATYCNELTTSYRTVLKRNHGYELNIVLGEVQVRFEHEENTEH